MNINYDQEVDVLRIIFSSQPIEESDEQDNGVIMDYDAYGKLVGIEVLNAFRQMENPDIKVHEV